MAPTSLRKLTSMQVAREAEIKSIQERLREKPRESLNRNIVQARLDAVKEVWSETRKTHTEIVVRDDAEADVYTTEKWFERIQGVYEGASDEILNLLSLFDKPDGDRSASDFGSESRIARLPQIPLPSFSGRYEDWSSFCDLFTSLVHNSPGLSDVTKLQYLKLCLTGGAAELIKDVATTNANYASTWKALNARYSNLRLTINKLLTALLEIPRLAKESASGMLAFVDEAQRIVRALENLKLPVEHWDVWLIFILADRLDAESRNLWEGELSAKDSEISADGPDETAVSGSLPKYGEFVKFLEKRARTLGMMPTDRRATKRSAPAPTSSSRPRKVHHASASELSGSSTCVLCSATHPLWKCTMFKGQSSHERLATVRRSRACFNCLGAHRANECPSSRRCSTCKGKHHSLLHVQQKQGETSGNPKKGNPGREQGMDGDSSASAISLHSMAARRSVRRVILATARIGLRGKNGNITYGRALLDQGSEVSFISEAMVQLLGLPRERACVTLTGLGAGAAGTARAVAYPVLISSKEPGFCRSIRALILPKLTSQLPAESITDLIMERFAGLQLADPEFFISKRVDVILGADAYGQLLRSGLKRFPPSSLVAQNTAFGWIISGSVQGGDSRRAESPVSCASRRALHCASLEELDLSLERFWKLEELTRTRRELKPEDEACEKIFRETHSRDSEGRYIVHLPCRANLPLVANETRKMALTSLASMHRRFARDTKFAQAYQEFIRDYERLGHMSRVPESEVFNDAAWYVPHHAVVQQSPWKIRVVFDASRKTRDGFSLNGFLYKGAPLQKDLSLILLNWRCYKYVFTADIVKMFRQIRVQPGDRDKQRIVWAPTPDSQPCDYRLDTVTYGTACAPFLAIRTLLQLIDDEGPRFPLGAACLRNETYVDDTFAGADGLSDAVQKRAELVGLLATAGFHLDKWAANHPDLLPPHTPNDMVKRIDEDDTVKALGVYWNPAHDQFGFRVMDITELSAASTKRSVLSGISRLFDPLGWLSPITVTAKILMQDLWIQKCEWDTLLPSEIRERWYAYCRSLADLTTLTIDRWLGVAPVHPCQLHGFSDASSRAFAAAIYLRVEDGINRCKVSLLAAKTKIAPVKTVSIPNLELCGAALLVRLVGHLKKLEFLKSIPVFAWTDSQIVLTWLRKHPCSWKTFVANRVSYIQTELPSATWAHVPSKENPADLATRGLGSAELAGNKIWWQGPRWLSEDTEEWPKQVEVNQAMHLARQRRQDPPDPEILTRFSSLTRLTRVVAFCRRPLLNLRRGKNGEEKLPCYLTVPELGGARRAIIILSQTHSFAVEIKTLREGAVLPRHNRLNKLNPFLDSDAVLRVGGRLEHSALAFEKKHPPILAQDSQLSLLFVRYAHQYCLHGGAPGEGHHRAESAFALKTRRFNRV